MPFSAFLQGIVIGFTLAAAVGPIALLLMQRTLARGWWVGIISGLGIALADGSYGLLGGLGLAAVNQFLKNQETPMLLAGGAVLILIGIQIMRTDPRKKEEREESQRGVGYVGTFSSMYMLTISNPLTIFSFAAIYTSINLGAASGTWQGAVLFSISVFFGSFSWWLILVSIIHKVRERFSLAALRWVNVVSGVLIAGLGSSMIIKLFL